MSDMTLQAMMKLDSAGFTAPLQGVQNAIGGTIRNLAALAGISVTVAGAIEGVKMALTMGGELKELSQRTGVAIADLVILRQAFNDTGVGAQSGVGAITLMQKALSGMNEEGEPTNKMFQQLGLNLEQIKKLSTIQQLQTIGKAIMQLKDPAEQTAAAMAIFGRSGAAMKQFFADPKAIEDVTKRLGSLPGALAKNAALFDEIGDKFSALKENAKGFWVAIAENVAPVLQSLTDSLGQIDFTEWGRRVGSVIGVLIQALKEGKLSELVGLSLKIGFGEAVNFLAGTIGSLQFWTGMAQMCLAAFTGIGGALLGIFTTPIMGLIALINKGMDELFAGLAKVPKLNKLLGLENYGPSMTFDEHLAAAKSTIGGISQNAMGSAGQLANQGLTNMREGMGSANIIDTSGWKSEISDLWAGLDATAQKAVRDAQAKAAKAAEVPEGMNKLAPPEGKTEKTKWDVATDRFLKIGGIIGGGGPALDHSKRTASATERMAKTLDAIKTKLTAGNKPVAVWAG